jgi:hypothetical protein
MTVDGADAARARARGAPPAGGVAAEAMDDVAGDAVAAVLAILDGGDHLGVLGIVDEQVAQQPRRLLDVLAGLLEQRQQLRVEEGAATQEEHRTERNSGWRGRAAAPWIFTRGSRVDNDAGRGGGHGARRWTPPSTTS